jgi:gamma-glutamyltranspeptidase
MFANAANWIDAGSNPLKGTYGYIDTESISTQGSYKQAFLKVVDIPTERYVVALTSYDCKSNPKRTKTTHLTVFDLEGNVIVSNSVNSSFDPVLPESGAEIVVGIVCNF